MAPPGLADYNGFATDENGFSAGVTLVGSMADAVTVRLQPPASGGGLLGCRRPDGRVQPVDMQRQRVARDFPPYLEAARRMTSPKPGRPRSFTLVSTAADPSAVRAWAASNGVQVSARNRVSAAMIEQYPAAGN